MYLGKLKPYRILCIPQSAWYSCWMNSIFCPNSCVEVSPNFHVTMPLNRWLRLNEVIRIDTWRQRTDFFIEKEETPKLALSFHACWKGRPCAHSEKTATTSQEKKPQNDTYLAGSWILGFQPPKRWGTNLCHLTPTPTPSLQFLLWHCKKNKTGTEALECKILLAILFLFRVLPFLLLSVYSQATS